MTIRTQSQCLGCQKTLHTKGARTHLKSCIAKAETPPGRTTKPMLLVSATAGCDETKTVYALYTLMPKNATLRDIDELLRGNLAGMLRPPELLRFGRNPLRLRRVRYKPVRLRRPVI